MRVGSVFEDRVQEVQHLLVVLEGQEVLAQEGARPGLHARQGMGVEAPDLRQILPR